MSTFAEMSPIPIKELLIEATFAPNRALRPGVDAIDLGVLGQEAERIYDKSVNGDRNEYVIPAMVTNDKNCFYVERKFVENQLM